MRAVIFLGGECDTAHVEYFPQEDDLVIAADGGYLFAREMNVTPALCVGDFDSMDESLLPSGAEKIRVPAEKNFTDAYLAVHEAQKRGATAFLFLGGLGGRLDHTLSALTILEFLCDKGIRNAVIDNGCNRVRLLRNDSTIIPRSHRKYLSVLAVDPCVRGVEIDGVRYPLDGKNRISRTDSLCVSNEITGNCAFVAVKKGTVLVVES